VEEKHPNCFPANTWNQSSLHGFLGYQSNRPSGVPLWRITANHSNDAFPLLFLQQGCGTRPSFIVQRLFNTGIDKAPSDFPHSLGRQTHGPSDFGGRHALVQVSEGQRSEDGPNRLNAST
jgi:hypothetical protein